MRTDLVRRVVVAATALAATATVTACAAGGTDSGASGDAGSSASPDASPTSAPGSGTSSDDGSSGSNSSGSGSTGSGDGSASGGSDDADGTEQHVEDPGSDVLGDHLPAPRRLLPHGLPASATRTGGLAPGFPPALRPPHGSSVRVSSLVAEAPRVQVSLVATTPQATTRAAAWFRGRLARTGMTETEGSATPGSTTSVFRGGGSTVTLTLRREGATTHVSLVGVLVEK